MSATPTLDKLDKPSLPVGFDHRVREVRRRELERAGPDLRSLLRAGLVTVEEAETIAQRVTEAHR
jgi:hypothetical protein